MGISNSKNGKIYVLDEIAFFVIGNVLYVDLRKRGRKNPTT